MTKESVQYSTETHFKLAKNRGGCRSQRQQQRCLLPKVITLSASQPSSSKKPYFFATSQRIRRCIVRITSFLRNQYNRSLERKSLYFGVWNIWRQARWWLWDCLMCHPKAYWKVSLFRTTTGEKFEIRYINVVRVESSGFWSYIHTHTRCHGGGKKVYPITYFFGVAQPCCRLLYFPISSGAGNAF